MKNFKRKIGLLLAGALVLTSLFGTVAMADDDWHSDDESEQYNGDRFGYMYPGGDTGFSICVGETTSVQEHVVSSGGAQCWVTWSASRGGIIDILEEGSDPKLKGIGVGETELIATLYVDGVATDTDTYHAVVYEGHIDVQKISLSQTSLNLQVGYGAKLNYSIWPDNATNKKANYYSSDSNIVRVDDNGNVFAVNPGNAVIKVRTIDNGLEAYCNVYVYGGSSYIPVAGIAADHSSVTVGVGQSVRVIATIYPINATNNGVTYRSNNPSIATVDGAGNITGVSVGSTIVTCTSNEGGFVDYIQVNIVAGTQGDTKVIDTRDANFMYGVVAQIVAAPKNSTVTLQTLSPMSYDSCVATALKARPDVTLTAVFPYNNGIYSMTVPASYDLTSQLDKAGYVEWVNLANRAGIVLTRIQ